MEELYAQLNADLQQENAALQTDLSNLKREKEQVLFFNWCRFLLLGVDQVLTSYCDHGAVFSILTDTHGVLVGCERVSLRRTDELVLFLYSNQHQCDNQALHQRPARRSQHGDRSLGRNHGASAHSGAAGTVPKASRAEFCRTCRADKR